MKQKRSYELKQLARFGYCIIISVMGIEIFTFLGVNMLFIYLVTYAIYYRATDEDVIGDENEVMVQIAFFYL